MIATAVIFAGFWLLITYFPGLAKVLGICFLASLIILLVNPALGAQFTMIWLGLLGLALVIAVIPFILIYLSGILFVALFFYGVSQIGQ
jgi:hypothetical protein